MNSATPADPQHWPALFQKPGVCRCGIPLCRTARADRPAHSIQAQSQVTRNSLYHRRAVPTGPWHHPR